MNLNQLKDAFVRAGARRLYAKRLSENDNSKNQIYLGPDFQALNLLPIENIVPDSGPTHPIFKARLRFGWLHPTGALVPAPGAQLILYPQYPEVRLSGFLKGCPGAPSTLLTGRIPGRVLFIGVTSDRQVAGYTVGSDDEIAGDFRALNLVPTSGVLVELDLPNLPTEAAQRTRLLRELRRIHQLGWIDSKQLDSEGRIKPCVAPQCGGFTLEAELGIPKNSKAGPDYLGWEVKQHAVTSLDRPASGGSITLMTPEPTGGMYRSLGVERFIRRYGYTDREARPDRINFGGIYRVGERQPTTMLTMTLVGYDAAKHRIDDPAGAVVLVSDSDEVAAEWAFTGLLAHWSRKHIRAAYVPSLRRTTPQRQYFFGSRVRLAEGTDGLRLLGALAAGHVYYDPGIKLEGASTRSPVTKRRSQFRVASKDIAALYERVETVEV